MINCTQNLVVCFKSVIYFGATVVTIFVLMIMVSLMQLPSIYGYRQSNITLDFRPLKCLGNDKSTVKILDLRFKYCKDIPKYSKSK